MAQTHQDTQTQPVTPDASPVPCWTQSENLPSPFGTSVLGVAGQTQLHVQNSPTVQSQVPAALAEVPASQGYTGEGLPSRQYGPNEDKQQTRHARGHTSQGNSGEWQNSQQHVPHGDSQQTHNVPRHTAVESVPSHSQQQTAFDTGFSPLSAFPCHHQHRIVQHDFGCAMKMLFAVWIADTVVWFLNGTATLAYFIVDSNGVILFGLSFLWLPLFSLQSFAAYYTFYASTRMVNNTYFAICVCLIVFEILTGLVAAMGIPYFTVGFINGLATIGKNFGAGFIMTLVGFLFGGMLIVHIVVFVLVLVAKCRHGSVYRQDIDN